MYNIPQMKNKPISHQIKMYPIVFFDYIWVVAVYFTATFITSVILEGVIFPQYNKRIAESQSSFYLAIRIIFQLSVQGFAAILLGLLLQKIPTPFDRVFGYDKSSSLGKLIRKPEIILVILMMLSMSLRDRLLTLYVRFDKMVNSDKQDKTKN
jgi:hypothetical protein